MSLQEMGLSVGSIGYVSLYGRPGDSYHAVRLSDPEHAARELRRVWVANSKKLNLDRGFAVRMQISVGLSDTAKQRVTCVNGPVDPAAHPDGPGRHF